MPISAMAAVMISLLVACGDSGDSSRPSAALLLSGSPDDSGWNESAAIGIGRLTVEGWTTAVSSNTAPTQRAERLEALASAGFDLIFAHGSEFDEALALVAPAHPSTQFVQTNGVRSASNLRSFRFSDSQIGWVLGVAAAAASSSRAIGVILQEDESDALVSAVERGARSVVSDATVVVGRTPDYDTPAYGRSAALELLGRGVDAIVVYVDGAYAGVHEALSSAPATRTYRLTARSSLAPDESPEVMCGVVLGTGDVMTAAVDEIHRGAPPSVRTVGFREGALRLTEFSPAYPPSARSLVEAAVRRIEAGDILP